MRYCCYCKATKTFDASAKKWSKASGFLGARCWDCVKLEKVRASQASRATDAGLAASRQHALAYAVAHLEKSSRHAVKQQTPPWAKPEKIRAWYVLARAQRLTVDHIIPLKGQLVSGLHVENNLQLLTKSQNSRKGNRIC